MARMIDQIRKSALASNMMQFAAKGALMLPPKEMLEILVYLATHNKMFGEQARLTLAGWDEAAALKVVADPSTPKEVLDYLIDRENLRPTLLPALLENPSVGEASLVALAAAATREQVEMLSNSPRVAGSVAIMNVLVANPNLAGAQAKKIEEQLSAQEPASAASAETSNPGTHAPVQSHAEAFSETAVSSEDGEAAVPDEVVNAFLTEHAAEIAAESGSAFQPVGGIHEPVSESDQPHEEIAEAAVPAGQSTAAGVRRAPVKKSFLGAGHEKGSALKKIAGLDIKGRIQLAMKGNKEERSLLIRDGTKVVALAVLESPKITDSEVEKFASQKNVIESVLRAIPMKRRFMKIYPAVRNLVFNPRTPIDVSLGLMKNLLIQDLRNLSGNKEVSETVRKLGTKMFRQKLEMKK